MLAQREWDERGYAFPERNALRSEVSAIEDSHDDKTTGTEKPSPRRVAQEGFMATPVRRHEPTDISVNPRSSRQHHRLEQTIDARSSPSRVIPAWWGAPGDAGRLRVGTGGAQAAHRGDGRWSRGPMTLARSDIE